MFHNRDKKMKIETVNTSLPPPKLDDFEGGTFFKRVRDYDNPENDNVTFLNGVGSYDANVMFITDKPNIEDIDDSTSSPMLLKSQAGIFFQKLCFKHGLDLYSEYFTTIQKFYTNDKLISAANVSYCYDLLEEEIAKIRPKIIVCVGKAAVSRILELNISISQLEESFIYSSRYKCRVFVISHIYKAFFHPEYCDKLNAELGMLADFYHKWAMNLPTQEIEQNYEIVDTQEKLCYYIDFFKKNGHKLFAVDCEWEGVNYYDGKLRSMQLSWKEGNAIYLNFHDTEQQWQFDCDFDTVKKILQSYFNNPDIHYIGHNFAADALWMKNHLGLEVYNGKCIFDTMFALQVADEYDDRKLEKCAAKYTDLGRYDIPLILWKHNTKGIIFNEIDGYGKVPLDLLFPYACRDVDATYRLYSIFKNKLIEDNVYDYYINIRHPFVTETFAQMSEVGIPLSVEDTEKMRISFTLCSHVLEKIFLKELFKESQLLICNKLIELYGKSKPIDDLLNFIDKYIYNSKEELSFEHDISKILKKFFDIKQIIEIRPYFDHFQKCKFGRFNINSSKDKVVWLFDVKKYTPLKSTKNEDGLSTLWEKVLTKPPKEQKKYTPAVDKSTLKTYYDNGEFRAGLLLQLMAVMKLTLSFFSTKDDKGLLPYRNSDGRVRCLFSCTETGRPTSFKPNLLNIPKGVSDSILKAYEKVLNYFGVSKIENSDEFDYSNLNQELFNQELKDIQNLYNIDVSQASIDIIQPRPIRWAFKAPDGYAFIDADYVSAEVFAIAYLSNDQNLIKALTEEDPQFGYIGDDIVRIKFDDNIVLFSDKVKSEYKDLIDENDNRLKRNSDGSIVHPKRDIYWELVESIYYMDTPREILEKKYKGKGRDVYRTSGKIANFLITYGGTEGFLEAQIGVVTGHKPEPGTGHKIIEAFKNIRSNCWKFKTECEQLPLTKGYYLSPSGYKRHFKIHDLNDPDISDKVKNAILAPLQRQACNVGLQSLVADSLARASYKLNSYFINHNMKSRIVNPLYDALYVLAPFNEISEVKSLMTKYMADENFWDLPGGKLIYKLDFELTKRWASKPSKLEKEEIDTGILRSN